MRSTIENSRFFCSVFGWVTWIMGWLSLGVFMAGCAIAEPEVIMPNDVALSDEAVNMQQLPEEPMPVDAGRNFWPDVMPDVAPYNPADCAPGTLVPNGCGVSNYCLEATATGQYCGVGHRVLTDGPCVRVQGVPCTPPSYYYDAGTHDSGLMVLTADVNPIGEDVPSVNVDVYMANNDAGLPDVSRPPSVTRRLRVAVPSDFSSHWCADPAMLNIVIYDYLGRQILSPLTSDRTVILDENWHGLIFVDVRCNGAQRSAQPEDRGRTARQMGFSIVSVTGSTSALADQLDTAVVCPKPLPVGQYGLAIAMNHELIGLCLGSY